MANIGITTFVNLTKNFAASSAQNFVSGVAGGLRGGLQGSSTSKAPIAKQSSFTAAGTPYLHYPSDLGSDPRQANYILFTAFSVTNAKLKKPKDMTMAERMATVRAAAGRSRDISKEAAKAAVLAASNTHDKGTGRNYTSSLLSRRNTLEQVGRTIGLYMPPQVTSSYNMDYGEDKVGVVAEVLNDIIKDVQAGMGAEQVFNRIAAGPASVGLKDKSIGLLNTVIPGARTLAAIETGSVITPKMELMFKGVGRRSFSFTFTFMPTERFEAAVAQEIIEEFKLRMHPEFVKTGIVRQQTIPDIYEIAYWTATGPNKNLHRIGKCFLEKVDVKYGGDKFQTFEGVVPGRSDGAPIKTELTLQFREIEILDRTSISEGF
tara:strand:- start:2094 stop:3221 length:1128 start_codon:yes stop_codon:yes gene_type:complete